MRWVGWRLRLAWARHLEGHLVWLLDQVECHPYRSRRLWEDDLHLLRWRATVAAVTRQRLELNEP